MEEHLICAAFAFECTLLYHVPTSRIVRFGQQVGGSSGGASMVESAGVLRAAPVPSWLTIAVDMHICSSVARGRGLGDIKR